jgi:hypothetical protein
VPRLNVPARSASEPITSVTVLAKDVSVPLLHTVTVASKAPVSTLGAVTDSMARLRPPPKATRSLAP